MRIIRFVNDTNFNYALISLVLALNGKSYESWSDVYGQAVAIDAKWQPSGYTLRLPFYVVGPGDAHILLHVNEKPTVEDQQVYEIRIGTTGNSLTVLSKQIGGEVLHRVYEQNLLSQWKPTKLVIELSPDGVLNVFSAHNPYAPLLTWKDSNPLAVKYISFASGARVQYFWDVNEETILTVPPKPPVPEKQKHPILSLLEFPVNVAEIRKSELVLLQSCGTKCFTFH